jgi:hypothetical protein
MSPRITVRQPFLSASSRKRRGLLCGVAWSLSGSVIAIAGTAESIKTSRARSTLLETFAPRCSRIANAGSSVSRVITIRGA